MIPKLVMQTWKTKTIPKEWQEGYESVNNTMPAYKHVLMTDEDNLLFVEKYFPDFLTTFKSYKYGIQRADAIRYMWLYIHGGIYLDLDYKVLKSLEPLVADCEITIGEDRRGSFFPYANMLMASVPKHPFWLECIDLMKKRSKNNYIIRSVDVLMKTGPGIVNHIAKHWENKDGFKRIPAKLINPCTLCEVRQKSCPQYTGSYLSELEGGSWNSSFEKCILFMYCNAVYVLFALVMLIPPVWILFKKETLICS